MACLVNCLQDCCSPSIRSEGNYCFKFTLFEVKWYASCIVSQCHLHPIAQCICAPQQVILIWYFLYGVWRHACVHNGAGGPRQVGDMGDDADGVGGRWWRCMWPVMGMIHGVCNITQLQPVSTGLGLVENFHWEASTGMELQQSQLKTNCNQDQFWSFPVLVFFWSYGLDFQSLILLACQCCIHVFSPAPNQVSLSFSEHYIAWPHISLLLISNWILRRLVCGKAWAQTQWNTKIRPLLGILTANLTLCK